LGTRKPKIISPNPQNEKTGRIMNACEPSHWLHELFVFKIVCHHFWLGLMARATIWGHRIVTMQKNPLKNYCA
jgi:hypothetical protein